MKRFEHRQDQTGIAMQEGEGKNGTRVEAEKVRSESLPEASRAQGPAGEARTAARAVCWPRSSPFRTARKQGGEALRLRAREGYFRARLRLAIKRTKTCQSRLTPRRCAAPKVSSRFASAERSPTFGVDEVQWPPEERREADRGNGDQQRKTRAAPAKRSGRFGALEHGELTGGTARSPWPSAFRMRAHKGDAFGPPAAVASPRLTICAKSVTWTRRSE